MANECEQRSLSNGTCDCAWEETEFLDRHGDIIVLWDTSGGYCIDEQHGWCEADGWEFPGDACEYYNPSNSGDHCDRCGEYMGYGEEDDEDYEESECRCDDE